MMRALEYLAGGIPAPCPADLWCDAAVIAQDGACSWPDALNGAAAGAGFTDFDEAAIVIVGTWRAHIRTAQPQSEQGRQAVRDALRMLHDCSGDLIRCGWPAVDLFGLAPSGNRHGLAFLLRGGTVAWVTPEIISYRRGATGRVCDLHRSGVHPDALAFWELS